MNRIFDYDIIRNQKLSVMKSFNSFSRPFGRSIIIAFVFVSSMAFRDPYSGFSIDRNVRAKKTQLADTIPKNDININIDVTKILAEVDMALAKIDFEQIAKDVQLSIAKIDFEKMKKNIDASLNSIDWKKVNKDIKNSLEKIDHKKIKIEVEKSMEDAKKHMNSEESKQSMQKLKEINMNQIQEELKKAQIETRRNMELLKKEIQRLQEETDQKDAVMYDWFQRDGLILM
ncbi:MAG: hypothetical protein ABIO76_10345 [Ginsengibacter sp.]